MSKPAPPRQRFQSSSLRVCWIEFDEARILEPELITRLDLPLHLDQNRQNSFHSRLKELRSQAPQRARELAVSS
ncbi:GIY-YIG nuclease family protein [Streptomyces sp. NPDC057094]|uniref:GIY-YIG nuclease family protein n=1 Tax=Streptomyces sp. NPDC057094 TaxID=3346018 RepID=UPI00362F0621